MATHQNDPDHSPDPAIFDELTRQLTERADEMTRERANTITVGDDDEAPLKGWKHRGMSIQKLPDDAQGVLRISVGGNVGYGYCTFRGSQEACVTILQQALDGLKKE